MKEQEASTGIGGLDLPPYERPQMNESASGNVGELNLIPQQVDSDTAGGKVGELNLDPLIVDVNTAGGKVGVLNLDQHAPTSTATRTPVKRRLTFGDCMTPEVANSRATPGSKQHKRKTMESQGSLGSARKRRHTLSSGVEKDNRRGELALTPIQRIMLAGKKTTSMTTPRRYNGQKKRASSVAPRDDRQKTIIQMMAQQAHTPTKQESVTGIKELSDKSRDHRSETGDVAEAGRMINNPESNL